MKKHMRLITALSLGMATLAISTLATADVTINIVGATLLARGAGVSIALEVTCTDIPAAFFDELCTGITQRSGNGLTGGGDCTNFGQPIVCDGTSQPFDVVIICSGGEEGRNRPCKAGLAIADAFTEICSNGDPFFCQEAETAQEIRISK